MDCIHGRKIETSGEIMKPQETKRKCCGTCTEFHAVDVTDCAVYGLCKQYHKKWLERIEGTECDFYHALDDSGEIMEPPYNDSADIKWEVMK